LQLTGARIKEVIAVERLLRSSDRNPQGAYWADRPQLNWGVSPRTTGQAVVAAHRCFRQTRRGDRAGGLVRRPSAGPRAPQPLSPGEAVGYRAARSIAAKSFDWALARAGPPAPRAESTSGSIRVRTFFTRPSKHSG